MSYKDKDKQREANRKAQAKFKAKGITNCPPSGITSEGITEKVLPAVNLELCRTCGELLPALEKSRKQLGRCLSCVMGKTETGESCLESLRKVRAGDYGAEVVV